MSSLDEIRSVRIGKLKKLSENGIDPYPSGTVKSVGLSDAVKKFSSLSKKRAVVLSGRLVAVRGHGGSVFADIFDGDEKFQIYIKKDELGEKNFGLFEETVDIGDFVSFSGKLFTTKKKEKTLLALSWQILSKSLLPLPEKWHGLRDVEERFRKRYLDLISNHEVRKIFDLRTKTVSKLRKILDKAGFSEVETPILHPIPGGASAKPFKTHHNALDADLYLRIAPELYLKRLLVGGYEKVYEIGRCFRNEGIDATHNPEFTMLELYEAYANMKDHMRLVESITKELVKEVCGKKTLTYQGKKISFDNKFKVITFEEGLSLHAQINNYSEMSKEDIKIKAQQFGVNMEKGDTKAKLSDKIFKKVCRPKLTNPTFVLYYPLEILPLSKESKDNPGFADMYQLIAGGIELVKGFSELNNPTEQLERLAEQEKLGKAGDEEAGRIDKYFVEALEHGMPPAAGLGIGIGRLVMLLADQTNIREVVLFPTLRELD